MHRTKIGTGGTPHKELQPLVGPQDSWPGLSGAEYQKGRRPFSLPPLVTFPSVATVYEQVCSMELRLPIKVHNKMCMDAQILVHLGKCYDGSKDASSTCAGISCSSFLG